jgi:hypothetical protein
VDSKQKMSDTRWENSRMLRWKEPEAGVLKKLSLAGLAKAKPAMV